MVSRVDRYKSAFVQRGLEVPIAEKLASVAETTAVRRGRIEAQDPIGVTTPVFPQISYPGVPTKFLVGESAIGVTTPVFPQISYPGATPPPLTPPPTPPEAVIPQNIFADRYFSVVSPPPQNPPQNIFAPPPPPPPPKATVQPCGGKTPYAKNGSTGQVFCSEMDFLNAGFKIPKAGTPTPTKTCPPGYFIDSATRGSDPFRTAKCRRKLF